jgi:hypothetical protein
MLKKIFIFMICSILSPPLLTYGFDCNKPDFGSHIEDLNKEGYFVKHMDKDSISYYNSTGPCSIAKNYRINPVISYVFIENRLYARMMNIKSTDESHEDNRKYMESEVYTKSGIAPYEINLDGDWWVYQWPMEKDNTKHKIKIHSKTQEIKDAFYFDPLRKKLKIINDSDDPASLAD